MEVESREKGRKTGWVGGGQEEEEGGREVHTRGWHTEAGMTGIRA